MKPKFIFRCIASIVAILIACLSLAMGEEIDLHIPVRSSLDGLPLLIHLYDWTFPPVIITIHTATIVCIWSDFKFSFVMACIGILVMFFEPILIITMLKGI